jgi:hypothetical protein
VFNEVVCTQCGQLGIKAQDHTLINATALEFGQFVAQVSDSGWRQLGGVLKGRKVISGVRLEGEHATGHAQVSGLGAQGGQHGLVSTVNAIKIAHRQRASLCQLWVMKASKNSHVQSVV